MSSPCPMPRILTAYVRPGSQGRDGLMRIGWFCTTCCTFWPDIQGMEQTTEAKLKAHTAGGECL